MSSSPKSFSKPSPASSSHSSKLSDEDCPSKHTTSAVLFRGPPLDVFPSVAQHIASQLALSPPSPLKVFCGASLASQKRYPGYLGMVPQTYKLELNDLTGTTKAGYQRNSYAESRVASNGARSSAYTYQWWDTIEIPSMICSSPPHALALFAGLVMYIGTPLGEYKTETQDIFELFGGQVVNELSSPPKSNITHHVALKPSFMTAKEDLRAHGGLVAPDGVAIHPSWITSSIENGFLLPTSLFSLDQSNPAFQTVDRTSGLGTVPPFFTSDLGFLSKPLGLILSNPPSLPDEEPRACLEGRRVFFDLDDSQHLQLVQALSAVVSRMGAVVVSHLAKCDWVVTSKRSGAAHLYGLQHPEIIMGTLRHLMGNIEANRESPINPRSSLLFYPSPTGSLHWFKKSSIHIFISKRYPEEYRRYLSSLFFSLTGYLPLESGRNLYSDGILIAPCCTPFDGDNINPSLDLSNRVLRPKFIENAFLNFETNDTFDLTTFTFRDPRFECFAPSKLPKNFASLEFIPARIPVSFFDRWSELETRWELHEKCEEKKKDCKCSSCANLW